jgi:Tol biopolymer transport system component
VRYAIPFCALVVVGGAAAGASASHAVKVTTIRLAYAAEGPKHYGIYRLDPGAKPVPVSTARGDGLPAWSPDAKSIAFVHPIKLPAKNPVCQLVVATGTAKRTLHVPSISCIRAISWGRNGLIAFDDNKDNVWAVKPDGSGLHELVRRSGSVSTTANPAWSPDGKSLAFGNGVVGGIALSEANGFGLHEITNPGLGGGDGFPAWSPDGKKIAFVRMSAQDLGTGSIMVARADGKGARRLAKPGAETDWARPAWSDDGVFVLYADVYGIEIVKATGGPPTSYQEGLFLAQAAVAPK